MKKTSSSKRTKKAVKDMRPEYRFDYGRARLNRVAVQSGAEAVNASPSAQTTKHTIARLLDNLPPESLQVVEQFVRFRLARPRRAADRALQSRPAALPLAESSYPTIPNPASSLANWLNALPQGYAGDALADTEALYGEQ